MDKFCTRCNHHRPEVDADHDNLCEFCRGYDCGHATGSREQMEADCAAMMKFINDKDAQFVGYTVDDVANAIRRAWESNKNSPPIQTKELEDERQL